MTCPPKVKLKTIKKSNFRYVSTQNRTLASLAFLVIRFLCLPARSFFAFWDATQTEISTTLSKVHIRALQKGIKRKKESEFCYTSDIDKKHFSLSWLSSSSSSSRSCSREFRLQIFNSVHASYTFTTEEKKNINLHRIIFRPLSSIETGFLKQRFVNCNFCKE